MPQKHLDRGRRAYDRRAWKDAHALLSLADRQTALRAGDLERLGTAAFLIGREKEFERALERAHRAYRDAGDRPGAARCAFWIGLQLFLRGKTGPATGWLARGQRLLDEEGRDTAEAGYLLLPVAEQHLSAGEWERARAVAREATGFGTRLGDRDLVAAARHVEGRTLLEMGRVEEGFALLDEAMLEVTSGELSPMMTGLVYCTVINCCQRVQALGRAREWTAALGRWCQDQRQMMVFTSTCLVHRAEILQLQGAWADALAEARRACQQHTDGPGGQAPGAAFYQQGEIFRLTVIVAIDYDPILLGYVARLAQPGGNITGVFLQQIDTRKRVELLREALPKVRRVGILWDASAPDQFKAAGDAARSLGLRVQSLELQSPLYDLAGALRGRRQGPCRRCSCHDHPGALPGVGRPAGHEVRLPTMFALREFAEAGGLMAYGPSLTGMYADAATLVDKILKGAKPADLPVEQPTKFQLVINAKTAKALGVTIPPSLLLRADQLIE